MSTANALYTREESVDVFVANSSPDDVLLALQFGWLNVAQAKRMRAPAVVREIAQVAGVRGEKSVMDALCSEFKCENSSKQTAAGDMSMWLDGCKLLVEVKNYSNIVPSSEVAKFRRDMSVQSPHAGMFVSLRTKITGIPTEVHVVRELLEDGTRIPCVYVCSSDASLIVACARMILGAASEYRSARQLRATALEQCEKMSTVCGEIGVARVGMYAVAAGCTEGVSKIAGQLSAAEKHLRECIDSAPAIGASDLVETVSSVLDGWQVGARAMTHRSGASIKTSVRPPVLSVPRSMFYDVVGVVDGGATVNSTGAVVDITDATVDFCSALLDGKY